MVCRLWALALRQLMNLGGLQHDSWTGGIHAGLQKSHLRDVGVSPTAMALPALFKAKEHIFEHCHHYFFKMTIVCHLTLRMTKGSTGLCFACVHAHTRVCLCVCVAICISVLMHSSFLHLTADPIPVHLAHCFIFLTWAIPELNLCSLQWGRFTGLFKPLLLERYLILLRD